MMGKLPIPTLEPTGLKYMEDDTEYLPFAQFTMIGSTYQCGQDLAKFQNDIQAHARDNEVHLHDFTDDVFLNTDIQMWERELKQNPYMKEVLEAGQFNMEYNMPYLHPKEQKMFYGTTVAMKYLKDRPRVITFDHVGGVFHHLMVPYYLSLIAEIAKHDHFQVIMYTRSEVFIHDFADIILNRSKEITGAFYRITKMRPDNAKKPFITEYSMEDIRVAREQDIPIL